MPVCLLAGTNTAPAFDLASSINGLGLDLYREEIKSAGNEDVLLSPYSIATALAMTYAGADGETRVEMERVLHLPDDCAASSTSFQALDRALQDVVKRSEQWVQIGNELSSNAGSIQLSTANRLFVQRDYQLRPAFAEHISHYFSSSLAALDFKHDPSQARDTINQWVAKQTHNRITQILSDPPSNDTRACFQTSWNIKKTRRSEEKSCD